MQVGHFWEELIISNMFIVEFSVKLHMWEFYHMQQQSRVWISTDFIVGGSALLSQYWFRQFCAAQRLYNASKNSRSSSFSACTDYSVCVFSCVVSLWLPSSLSHSKWFLMRIFFHMFWSIKTRCLRTFIQNIMNCPLGQACTLASSGSWSVSILLDQSCS
jgi:hypothetical protein